MVPACRYIERFIAAGGVQALTSVLENAGPLPLQLRLAVVALDSLTRCGGAVAFEAALGWWAPSLPQHTDAGLEHTGSQENGHDGTDTVMAEVC